MRRARHPVRRAVVRSATLALAVVLVVLGLPSVAPAATTTYYVDRSQASCSDAGPATQARPLCTIGAGAMRAHPGDTIEVLRGTYNERVVPPVSGTPGAPIVFDAADPSVRLTGAVNGFFLSSRHDITIRGFTISGTSGPGVSLKSCARIRVSGNSIMFSGHPARGFSAQGIVVRGTTASTFIGNTVARNSNAGIFLFSGSTGNVVQSNVTYANARGYTRAAAGIDIRSSATTVIGNLSFQNEDSGIQVVSAGPGNTIVDNVMWGNGDHGLDNRNSTGTVITSNTVYANTTAGINVEANSTGAAIANNISVDNALTNTFGQKGNIRVDATSIAGTTMNDDLAYLSTPGGALFSWGGKRYGSIPALNTASGQESRGLRADPKFISTSSHDLHLRGGSPGIDSANSAAPAETATDIEGRDRIDDPLSPNSGAGPRAFDDRGAYEYQPGAVDAGPDAVLTVTPTSGTIPVLVSADASASTSFVATPITTYAFDWGDGSAATGLQAGSSATHSYTSPGAFTVTVTVTDTAGRSSTATRAVNAFAVVDEIHYSYLGQDSVAIDWRGGSPQVRYGISTSYGQTATAATPTPLPFSSAGPFRELELTNLMPATTYHYSIGGGLDRTFATAPAAPFRFDVEADIGDSVFYPGVAPTQQQIAADQPAFVLAVGDLTYGNGHGQGAVDRHFNDVAPWANTAAYMPVWGNHEYETGDDLRNYKGRFAIPHAHASPGAPSEGCCGEDWGWFDAGGVRFISYPEPYANATWPDWRTNATPIMEAAQSDPSIHYIVTFGHRPAYSTGNHPGSATLRTIQGALGQQFSKYVLNLNGHSHDYERFSPINGVVNITTGGGGATLEAPWLSTDPSTVYRAMHLEHLRVDVSDSTMKIDAICGPATDLDDITCAPGSVIDSLTIPAPPPSDAAPIPALKVTLDQPGSLSVTADASASTDTDVTPIASYSFDFGDGSPKVGPQAGAIATHAYAQAGTYSVSVTVADTAGRPSSTTTSVTVTGTSEAPPTASLSVTPSSGTAPFEVIADASASTDDDDTPIASYTFDWGDGSVGTGAQAGATATHTYTTVGTFAVTVIVRDTADLSSSVTRTVSVDGVGSGNLISNPGFEIDLSGWNVAGRVGETLVRSGIAHSGAYSAAVTNTNTTPVQDCVLNDSPNWVKSTVPGLYQVSLWVRADSPGATLKLRIREYTASGIAVASGSSTVALATTWQQVKFPYITAASGNTLDFNAFTLDPPTGVCFYADDAAVIAP